MFQPQTPGFRPIEPEGGPLPDAVETPAEVADDLPIHDEPPPVAGAVPRRSGLAHTLYVMGKRRHFLVHRPSQLRAGMMTTVSVLALLILLNLSLASARSNSAEAILRDAPAMAPMIESQNRVEMLLVLAASIVFLAGVFFVTILETHKTAGAAFNLARHLNAIRDGHFATRLRLRKDDNLQELEPAFNEMSRSLQEQAWHDAESLERIAGFAEQVASPPEAIELAAELRRFAEFKRALAD